jgi:integrase
MEAYQRAFDAELPRADIGASRTKAGTVNASVIGYLASAAFTQGFAASTQAMRRAILQRFRADHGEKRVALLQRPHIVKLLQARKAYAQRNWLKSIRGWMAFAITQGERRDDPTAGVKAVSTGKSRGHMTWKEDQIATYRARHPIGTVARLGLELLLNIAARRGDAHKLGRPHMRDGRLSWRPSKTLRSTGKMLSVRIMPELQAALDAMPATESLTFLVNDYGKPFASAAAFGNKFADWCDAAGLPEVRCDDGRVRNFRAHGLRKAALRALAHAGCTGPEIMAISGHATLAQVQVYIDEVEQGRMADAAMSKRMTAAGPNRQQKLTNLNPETYKPAAKRLKSHK